ncbi:MAG: hypothetical protein LBE31_07705, partial [Deltaproteobacteria bacterium]|nr:hypothetical protein [Deltaproteobacteria bacterium]
MKNIVAEVGNRSKACARHNYFVVAKKGALLTVVLSLALAIFLPGCGLKERLMPSDHSKSSSGQSTSGSQSQGLNATPGPDPAALSVDDSLAISGVAPVGSSFLSDFRSVWVGSYLDPAPALKAAALFQKKGLVSFSIKKNLVDKSVALGSIGDYHLVLVGLFGVYRDAEALGKLLQAQGQITNWQVIASDRPDELKEAMVQTNPLVETSQVVTQAAQARSGKPMPADSPAVTGAGFKNLVKGRFIGSFRDPLEARKEAERLTAAGWPASVVSEPDSGGLWHRVYLAQATDRRDFKPKPEVLAAARASAVSRPGLVFFIDTTGLKGSWGRKDPDNKRSDASACAGYSRAGRLMTNLERLIGYVPDTSLLTVVKPIAYNEPDNILDLVVRQAKSVWTGD